MRGSMDVVDAERLQRSGSPLWGCKKNMFEGDVEENIQVKKALMQYINSKLDGCLGVKIEKYNKSGDCKEYTVKEQILI